MADKKRDGAAELFGYEKTPEAGTSAKPGKSDGASRLFEYDKHKEPTSPVDLWRETKMFGQGIEEGAAGIPGLVSSVPSMVGRGLNKLTDLIHTPSEEELAARESGYKYLDEINPGSAILRGLTNVGFYDPELKPENLPEQMLRTAGGAVGTMPLGLGSMSLGKNLLYSLLPSEVADVAQKAGVPPIVTAPLTALSMSGAERMWAQRSARQAAEQAARQAAAAKAAYELQTSEFGLGQKQAKDAVKEAAKTAKRASVADALRRHDSDVAAANAALQAEHVGATADREAVASRLGQSNTLMDGMKKMQEAARKWKKDVFPDKLKKAEEEMYYNPDGSIAIPEDAKGDLSQFRSVLKNSFYKAGELEPAAQQLRSRMPERLESALDEIAASQAKKPGTAPLTNLADMKKLRSILGDAMSSPKLMEGVDAGKMGELYAALSGDMEDAIRGAAGPEGVVRFRQFNEEAKRLYGLASGPVSDVISTTDKAMETVTPEAALNRVMSGTGVGGTKLAQLSTEPVLKEGVNEVAAAHLRMGKGPGKTDPDEFFKSLSPEAQTAMFGPGGTTSLQGSIDRRAAAETAAANAKAAADKNLAAQKQAAADAADAARDAAKKARDIELAERQKQGKVIGQEATETAAKSAELNKPEPGLFGGLKLPSLAALGTLYAGHFGLGGTFHSMGQNPDWVNALGYPAMGIAGALAGAGARELVNNPAVYRNMLQGTMPTISSNQDQLGWGVEYSKPSTQGGQ
jgi:hypothetical protein